MWNPKTGECTLAIQGRSAQGEAFHEEGIVSLVVSHDSQVVLSGSEDGGAILTNITNGRVVGSLKGDCSWLHPCVSVLISYWTALSTATPCPDIAIDHREGSDLLCCQLRHPITVLRVAILVASRP